MEGRTHRHHWTEQDDIVALYFTSSVTKGGHLTSPPLGSVAEWVLAVYECVSEPFALLLAGVSIAALQSRSIYERYANLFQPELRRLASL